MLELLVRHRRYKQGRRRAALVPAVPPVGGFFACCEGLR